MGTISTWFIVAQVFGVITLGFEFWSYQIKDKRKYLFVNGIAGIFWILMFVSIGMATSMSTQISLVIVGISTTLRAFVFWWIFAKNSKQRRMAGRIFLLVWLVISLVAAVLVFGQLPTRQVLVIQSVALFFALCFIVGQYLPGKHPVRLTVFVYAVMLFLTQTPLNILEGNGIERWNIMGMLIEASKMISVLVFYFLFFQKKMLAKKLVRIKSAVNCELTEINFGSDIATIADFGLLKLSKLEKLVAQMVSLEIKIIDTDELTNVGTIEAKTQAIMDDLKTVHDVKMILEKIVRLKRQRLEEVAIPKFANVQEEMKDVILGDQKELLKEGLANV